MVNTNESKKLLYLDPSLPIEKRVEDLISRMTIKEKVAQLGSQYAPSLMELTELSHEKMKRLIGQGIGQITRIGGTMNITPEESVKIANGIQKFLKEQTRLGIPAIVHEECLCVQYTSIQSGAVQWLWNVQHCLSPWCFRTE